LILLNTVVSKTWISGGMQINILRNDSNYIPQIQLYALRDKTKIWAKEVFKLLWLDCIYHNKHNINIDSIIDCFAANNKSYGLCYLTYCIINIKKKCLIIFVCNIF